MVKPAELWESFLAGLCDAVDDVLATDANALRLAWRGKAQRTSFNKSVLLPRIAKSLSLEFDGGEWLDIDHVFWAPGQGGVRTSAVFIESANKPEEAEKDVRKLCGVAAPLRVLLTVSNWDNEWPRLRNVFFDVPDSWETSPFTLRWHGIREGYTRAWPDKGVVGVVAAHWNSRQVLRYYAFELPPAGKPFRAPRTVFERAVNSAE